jgi:hypothetical protein
MAKFKCVHSGCVYELLEEEAIENMRLHAEYEEVAVPAPVAASKEAPKPKPKKEAK